MIFKIMVFVNDHFAVLFRPTIVFFMGILGNVEILMSETDLHKTG